MQRETPHYGDILRKVERSILSCTTLDQLNSARRLADLFAKHCNRIGIKQESVWVLTASITNKIEDKWSDLYENIINATPK
jgi:hypothetical protein